MHSEDIPWKHAVYTRKNTNEPYSFSHSSTTKVKKAFPSDLSVPCLERSRGLHQANLEEFRRATVLVLVTGKWAVHVSIEEEEGAWGQGNLDKILPGVEFQSVGLEMCLHQRGGVGGRGVVQKGHTPCERSISISGSISLGAELLNMYFSNPSIHESYSAECRRWLKSTQSVNQIEILSLTVTSRRHNNNEASLY
jgi:hypothetical protein